MVPLGSGRACFTASTTTHLVADISGYFT
jgi:hypothetical protein